MQLQSVKVTALPKFEVDFDYDAIGLSQWDNTFSPWRRIEIATINDEFVEWCSAQGIKFVPKMITFAKIVLEFFSEEDVMTVKLRWHVRDVHKF
jgi:hypothetical protein